MGIDLFTERCKQCWAVKPARKPCPTCLAKANARCEAFRQPLDELGRTMVAFVRGEPEPEFPRHQRGAEHAGSYGFTPADAMRPHGASAEETKRGANALARPGMPRIGLGNADRAVQKRMDFGTTYGMTRRGLEDAVGRFIDETNRELSERLGLSKPEGLALKKIASDRITHFEGWKPFVPPHAELPKPGDTLKRLAGPAPDGAVLSDPPYALAEPKLTNTRVLALKKAFGDGAYVGNGREMRLSGKQREAEIEAVKLANGSDLDAIGRRYGMERGTARTRLIKPQPDSLYRKRVLWRILELDQLPHLMAAVPALLSMGAWPGVRECPRCGPNLRIPADANQCERCGLHVIGFSLEGLDLFLSSTHLAETHPHDPAYTIVHRDGAPWFVLRTALFAMRAKARPDLDVRRPF